MSLSKIGSSIINTLTGGVLTKATDKVLDLIPDRLTDQEKKEFEVALKKMAHDQEVELIKLAKEDEEMYLNSVSNARSREVGVVNATNQKDWWLYALASTLVVGFFTVLGIVLYRDLSDNQTANVMLGYLAGAFSGVVTYFFGSSRGSQQKTNLLAKK